MTSNINPLTIEQLQLASPDIAGGMLISWNLRLHAVLAMERLNFLEPGVANAL